MRKSYKYCLRPTKRQAKELSNQLNECARLYNAALQERRDAYGVGTRIKKYDQTYQLKGIFAANDTGISGYSIAWHVLDRVDKAFQAFFRRIKRKEKPGYPRFRPASRYDSFDWQASNASLKDDKVRVPNLGLFKIKLHRPLVGTIKHCTIKREGARWFVVFSVEQEPSPLPASTSQAGIDVGLNSFAVLSNGSEVANPRFLKQQLRKLRCAQRRVARRKRRSAGRRVAVALLQKIHLRIRNQRNDFHHKLSRQLVNQHGLIAVEDLNIKGLARTRLARPILDAGWGQFLDKIAYKAEDAGRVFVRVNPNGTTQKCSGCGARKKKELSERTHNCDACGLVLNRDHNAALNILRLGVSLAGKEDVSRLSPAVEPSTQAPVKPSRKKRSVLAGACALPP